MSLDKLSTNTTIGDATRSMALNLADWHLCSVRHFGLDSFYTDALWWRQPGGSGIYLGAIVMDDQTPDAELFAELQALEERWGAKGFAIYDCWGSRDLSSIGFRRIVKNPWYLRPPAPAPALNLPAGLTIELVKTPAQLADFEMATWGGFEETDDLATFSDRATYSQHPLETLDEKGMVYLNARLAEADSAVVSSVIIHASTDMTGVYGISTLPRFRRRGYAAALIRAALALRPDLPMIVFPDPVSLPIYSVVGFEPAGEIAIWESSRATGSH